jgi:hypothetical protein
MYTKQLYSENDCFYLYSFLTLTLNGESGQPEALATLTLDQVPLAASK